MSQFWAALTGEWFRLVRRPALWITLGLFILLAVGLGYAIPYLVATHPPRTTGPAGGVEFALLRASLYPDSLLAKAVASASGLLGIFVLVLAVLAQGSEYGWGTLKTSSTQWPGRLTLASARALSLGVVLLAMTALLFALGATSSYVIATLDAHAIVWPDWQDIARALGATWLIFALLASLGFALATFFRNSAAAIGLGLGYALLIENLVFSLLSPLGDGVHAVRVWFPIANSNYLASSFGSVSGFASGAGAGVSPGATHAAIVLALWTAGLLVVSAWLVHRRDIV